MKQLQKLIECLSMLALFVVPAVAQTVSQNPFVSSAIIDRTGTSIGQTLLPVEFNGTGIGRFTVGNTGDDPLPVVLNQEMGLTISFGTYGEPNLPDVTVDPVASVIGGPGKDYFEWSYLPGPRQIIGKQILEIPAQSQFEVNFQYRVVINSYSPQQNGFLVNVQPPDYSNGTTEDDNASSYTSVEAFDYGDAPESYGVASHEINLRKNMSGVYTNYVYLGNAVDPEDGMQYSSDATGDDLNQTGGLGVDDEDGVAFPSEMIVGTTIQVPIQPRRQGNASFAFLSMWIDWEGNGVFTDVGNQVLEDEFINAATLTSGIFNAMIDIPANAITSAPTFARIRISRDTEIGPTGHAESGEVEDYMIQLSNPPGGAISGLVRADTTGDGLGDTLVAGVELRLLDENGDPVLDGGGFPITTTTDIDGFYIFEDVPAGSYQVAKTPSSSIYTSLSDSDGGDPDLIGSNTLITVVTGVESENNNFLEFLQACPDLWTEWQDKWETILGGETGLTDNPDGDRYSNLLEYAFCMPPNSGARKPFCLFASETVTGAVDGIFSRTAGGPQDITFVLDYTTSLGNPTVWNSIVLDGSNTTVTNNGNGKESVRIIDLETLTGMSAGEGFVRIRVELDNGTDTAEDATEVLGWVATELGLCCRTYNNPFLACATFTGTVGSVDGQELVLTGSTGTSDLSALLQPGVAYYIEVESGDLEGHRFDIVGATSDRLILANDPSLCSADAPFNTLTGAAPALLAGDRIAVHTHRTLDGLFPPASFGAGASHSVSDEVQVFAGGTWAIYWLYDDNGTARWVNADDVGLADAGATVIPPGQGVFFQNRTVEASILAYGEVRGHDFHRPLCEGVNLVGGGYPITQSATGNGSRELNLADGFFGSRDFKTADSFFIWRKDEDPTATGYDTYFLLNSTSPPVVNWVKVGDPLIAPRGAELLLKRDGAVMTRVASDQPGYVIPSPWVP